MPTKLNICFGHLGRGSIKMIEETTNLYSFVNLWLKEDAETLWQPATKFDVKFINSCNERCSVSYSLDDNLQKTLPIVDLPLDNLHNLGEEFLSDLLNNKHSRPLGSEPVPKASTGNSFCIDPKTLMT